MPNNIILSLYVCMYVTCKRYHVIRAVGDAIKDIGRPEGECTMW